MPESGWHAGYGRWLDWTSLTGLTVLLVAILHPPAGILSALIFHGVAAFSLWRLKTQAAKPADRVTQIRAAGILVLYLLVLRGGDWRLLLALASVLAATDLIDGWIARRTGATAFGAVFDMEMDQLMVTSLALIALYRADMPPWLLVFPAMRYLKLVVLRLLRLPSLNPKPKDGDNTHSRVICAIIVVVLLSNFIPGTTAPLRLLLNAFGLILLLWSYADECIFLFSRFRLRRPPV